MNTLPPETLAAFRDHGRVRESLTEDVDGARRRPPLSEAARPRLGPRDPGAQEEGVEKFADPFDRLISTLESKRAALLGP
ncbi:MAG: hypothetical protein R2991_09690 [Thermoanaerobaculia bacterium]